MEQNNIYVQKVYSFLEGMIMGAVLLICISVIALCAGFIIDSEFMFSNIFFTFVKTIEGSAQINIEPITFICFTLIGGLMTFIRFSTNYSKNIKKKSSN